ncbi:MAG: hypothetical protein IH598_08370 [Bacteroidales bacterium]|nr:hypothetical protein [Bacteroidales bacterium]
MKRIAFAMIAVLGFTMLSYAQEFKVVTIVESIVPAGLGRSRMVETKSDIEVDNFTTSRTDGKTSKQDDISRADAKVSEFDETKLLNFYSLAGINFQNIASNDALITAKINKLVKEGWKLTFVTSAVESDGGKEDGNGIFITRLFFTKD